MKLPTLQPPRPPLFSSPCRRWKSTQRNLGSFHNLATWRKAELEYERYRTLLDVQPRAVDMAFEQAVKELSKLPAPSPKKKKP